MTDTGFGAAGPALDRFLSLALAEDVGARDVTAEAVLPAALAARGRLLLREAGVVAGLEAALRVFELLDAGCATRALVAEGAAVAAGAAVAEVSGLARALVSGERLALNLLGRLSGVATLTRAFVDAVAGTGVAIVDTRKTTPLLRALEKAAVVKGGGVNHRFGLFDALLVKDNHLALVGLSGTPDAVARVTREARAREPGLFLQIEAETVEAAVAAVEGGADSVLFDNFRPAALAAAVPRVREAARQAGRRVVLEASGGVTLATVAAFAGSGVDRISIGALTHAARSLDVSLDLEGA